MNAGVVLSCPHCGGTPQRPALHGGAVQGKDMLLRGGGQATFEVAAMPVLGSQGSRLKGSELQGQNTPLQRMASDLTSRR